MRLIMAELETRKTHTMAIVGSRNESFGMRMETTKAANKALDAGWRIATGGARGTDATAIRAAVDVGKSNQLDVYLPARIKDQPLEVRPLLEAAKRDGANIVENATGKAQYDANGKCTNMSALTKPRNAEIVKMADAAVIMQNNQSRGSQDILTKALHEDIPIKKFTFANGILKTVAKFNLVGAALGIISSFLDYKETQEYFSKTQELMDKWKKGPPIFTKEDMEELKKRGIDASRPYGDHSTEVDPALIGDDAKYAGGGYGAGNPYHDGQGRFCSAEQAVVTCGS